MRRSRSIHRQCQAVDGRSFRLLTESVLSVQGLLEMPIRIHCYEVPHRARPLRALARRKGGDASGRERIHPPPSPVAFKTRPTRGSATCVTTAGLTEIPKRSPSVKV
jgi:hypothetical protein